MEATLMIVTLVSLVLGVGMVCIAWKMLRNSRAASRSRVAALEAMALDDDHYDRVELDDDSDWELGVPVVPVRVVPTVPVVPVVPERSVMFPATNERPTPGRRGFMLGAVAFVMIVMAAGVGAYYLAYGKPVAAADRSKTDAATAPLTTADKPLELLSLGHAIDRDGTFTVTGLVQNPAGGKPLQKVVAVVYVFDRDGTYVASGRAALDYSALTPGEESPFVVRVPGSGPVGRYRVGFRFEDGGVVAHIDRRDAHSTGSEGSTGSKGA